MRILVIKLSSLGDLFHALPAVHELKVGLGATVAWATQTEYAALVRCFSDVDRVIAFPRRSFCSGARTFLRELRAERYDIIVDLQGLLKSAFVARLARGQRRIGPSFHREGARFLYSEIAGERNKNRHAVEENLDVARHLGLAASEVAFPVRFPAVEVAAPRPRVAIVPSSRWQTKNWPPASFGEVARGLIARRNASVFLLGGPDDVRVCACLERDLDGEAVNLAGKLSLPEVGGYLAAMDLLIANDSGPVHMASAVETPSLVLFGPTDPARTGPYGNRHRVLRTDLPCQPCFSSACRLGDTRCMSAISPEQVLTAATGMLTST